MTKRISPSKHVAASIHDDGVVFLHTSDGRLFSSNRVGARIWEALERELPVNAIIIGITDRYGIPQEQAAGEVACFLTQLERHGLVEGSVGR